MYPFTKKSKYAALVLILAFFGTTSCTLFEESRGTEHYRVINDDEVLEERYTELDEEILVDTTQVPDQQVTAQKLKPPKFTLTLVSEVVTPVIDGEKVQATMVSINDFFRTVVSYNAKGSAYKGGVDLLEIFFGNMRIRSGIEFFDADINAVTAHDGKVWSAMATDNPDLSDAENRSALQAFDFRGFDLVEFSDQNTALPSFAANSVTIHDSRVFATSGDRGGLSVYDESLGNQLQFIPYADARWVDVNDDYAAVLLGDSDGDDQGDIVVLDPDTYEELNRFSFIGAYTAGAKSTVELAGHLAFIAAGMEGVKVMDLTTGDVVAEIPRPNPNTVGLSSDVVATNAVSVDGDLVFISNGEAGVYVAETDQDIADYSPGETKIKVKVVGQLQFDNLESVNHVDYSDPFLVIAAGLGGVKVVYVSK